MARVSSIPTIRIASSLPKLESYGDEEDENHLAFRMCLSWRGPKTSLIWPKETEAGP